MSKSGRDNYFLVKLTKNATGTGRYFLSVQRPDMDGYNDQVIGDFFSIEELRELRNKLSKYL